MIRALTSIPDLSNVNGVHQPPPPPPPHPPHAAAAATTAGGYPTLPGGVGISHHGRPRNLLTAARGGEGSASHHGHLSSKYSNYVNTTLAQNGVHGELGTTPPPPIQTTPAAAASPGGFNNLSLSRNLNNLSLHQQQQPRSSSVMANNYHHLESPYTSSLRRPPGHSSSLSMNPLGQLVTTPLASRAADGLNGRFASSSAVVAAGPGNGVEVQIMQQVRIKLNLIGATPFSKVSDKMRVMLTLEEKGKVNQATTFRLLL